MSGRRLISGKQALDVEMDLRQGLYSHFVRLSFGFYDRNQTGQLMSRATVDLQGVRFFLGYGLIFFFQNALTVVSVTVVLFFLEWKLALVVLAVMPFLVAIAYRYSHVAHPTLRDVQQKLADVATVAEENIVGVHVVKAFAQEPAEEAKFARAERGALRADDPRQPAARDLRAAPLVPAAARAGGACCSSARGWSRTARSRSARSSPSTSSSRMLVMPLRSLGMWVGQAQRATASGERIFQILDEPEDVADRAGGGRPARRRRRDPLRGRLVLVPRRAGRCSSTSTSRSTPGRRSRSSATPGSGQDDALLARAALLRRRLGARARRRRGRARREARVAAPRDRRHRPGSVPLLDDGARQHRVRPPRADRRARSSASRGSRRRTSSSSACRRATTPSSASAASRSRAGSGSGSRSRAPSRSTRASSSSTTRPPRSTRRRRRRSAPGCAR